MRLCEILYQGFACHGDHINWEFRRQREKQFHYQWQFTLFYWSNPLSSSHSRCLVSTDSDQIIMVIWITSLKYCLGGMVAQWVALLPHSSGATGSVDVPSVLEKVLLISQKHDAWCSEYINTTVCAQHLLGWYTGIYRWKNTTMSLKNGGSGCLSSYNCSKKTDSRALDKQPSCTTMTFL